MLTIPLVFAEIALVLRMAWMLCIVLIRIFFILKLIVLYAFHSINLSMKMSIISSDIYEYINMQIHSKRIKHSLHRKLAIKTYF